MKINLSKLLHAMTTALDYVEVEIIHTARNHGKRVAVLTNHMAIEAGMDTETVYALTQTAVLHDCALAEYLKDEIQSTSTLDESNMAAHCVEGEKMLLKLPFYSLCRGAVLYHHERADGTGALSRLDNEIPLCAKIIHIADALDVHFDMNTMTHEKFLSMLSWINAERGKSFSDETVNLFLHSVDEKLLTSIAKEGCRVELRKMLPSFANELSIEALREIASFFARITDYKSAFTWAHSLGIAEKAEQMGRYYGYDYDHCSLLYIAGALHDIGKLMIPNDILEKPGKLTNTEYRTIQNHALGTWELLHDIDGFEEIARWAALHHEKLDGSGYPFGYTGDHLNHEERLLACLDIYQALTETRPYKAGKTHTESMEILNRMGASCQLDKEILKDLDHCFAPVAEKKEALSIYPSTGNSSDVFSSYEGEIWLCPVCGYVYHGKLPDDFICPKCEQPGTIFERVHDD